ncbi:toxin A [Clostridium saccharobutylicum]|uniref:N-acetylmuramoyl-L-alanine amidase family protein n=1 Tax=Clostridium saccharobutylicum TaxID=169679 RepID=UPI000983D7D6|nr:cadherin-like beta sandwich domain-containing protein [Clostridium saccharobutylicum]AQS11898.1 toxin A [Clostridium saccharobutylicum]MBC2435596.1 cell wall-binding protein [Clostridium saccharobutylicum]NSB87002.1 glucan-binding YG repeat protein [Clostridium saccharobutylicum]NYC30092.1 glucan-binding YG repeat protein [Clostridium saccharobutylicum]OOM18760.1 toxin A [Clostridium saccharobutylicum]
MNKLHKRFIAMLVIFTSLISFLPVKFGGQVAKADEGTDIQVSADGSTTPLPSTVDTSTSKNEVIYTSENTEGGFSITASDVRTTQEKLTQLAKDTQSSQTGIISQEVQIVSINGIQSSGVGTDSDPNFSSVGIKDTDYANPLSTSEKRVGRTILNLPLGVNKIVYRIKITKLTMNCEMVDSGKVDSSGNPIKVANVTKGIQEDINHADGNLTIEHANNYVIDKIKPMVFNAYIKSQDVDNESTIENNTRPFLYSTTAKPDSKMPLRYTYDVPDSTSILTYDMTLDSSLVLDGAKIYKNGNYDSSATITNSEGHGKLHGSLSRIGNSDTILIKLDPSAVSGNGNKADPAIQKSYAIEIRYKTMNATKDYSIYDNAGITKLNYNEEADVPAYIGKKFTVGTINDTDSTPVYTGQITIDKRAEMISLDPALVRSRKTVAYKLTNHYKDTDDANEKILNSELKNGKQYINFAAGSLSNTLYLDVYEGDGQSRTGNLLARYILNVINPSSTDTSNLSLLLDDGNAELTQPGVKSNKIAFSQSRRTYDLYAGDTVNVKLQGTSSKNEYIKVWLADEIDSNNLTEADASKANTFNQSSGIRSDSLNVSVGKSKKMIVQAYYDKYTEQTDSNGNKKKVLVGSYPVGDKYYFYLPKNFNSSDNTNNNTDKSSDALLSSLKIKGATLTDSNGNSGFSSSTDSYNVSVDKDCTSVSLTATSEDQNAKSIVATVSGSEDSSNLVSGESTDLTLNSSGTTNINIVVTAQDGTTTKAYSIIVKNSTKSSNDKLKNVILSTGDYTFDSSEDTTKVRVDLNATSIKVTPVVEDPNSTVTVNGQKYSNDPINVSLKGAQKTDIEITVKSEDGKSTQTYTLEVTRTDSSNNNTDNGSDEQDQFYDDISDCWVDLNKYDEWGKVNDKPVYFDKKHKQVKNQWVQTKGEWYYLNNVGYRASGWKVDTDAGKTYYLSPVTGKLMTGWMNLDNNWYYMGGNGVMHKGWLYLNGKWYYFAPNGQMVVNQSMYIDGKMYKFAVDGSVIF